MYSGSPVQCVTVMDDQTTSDHLPICVLIPVVGTKTDDSQPKWFLKKMWNNICVPELCDTCDRILVKLKVPYHVLQPSINLSENELRLQLNLYCEEIIYALKCADKAAIPVRWMRCKSEKYRWSSNPALASACATAKWCLRLWEDCGKPRTGAVNTVRIYSKRIFRNALQSI